MKPMYLTAIVATALCVAACNKAEAPATVQSGVAAATSKAQADTAEVRTEATENINDKLKELGKSEGAVAHAVNEGAYELAVSKAEGEHRIAVEKCESLAGAEQRACKDKADADLKLARAKAEQTKPS